MLLVTKHLFEERPCRRSTPIPRRRVVVLEAVWPGSTWRGRSQVRGTINTDCVSQGGNTLR